MNSGAVCDVMLRVNENDFITDSETRIVLSLLSLTNKISLYTLILTVPHQTHYLESCFTIRHPVGSKKLSLMNLQSENTI